MNFNSVSNPPKYGGKYLVFIEHESSYKEIKVCEFSFIHKKFENQDVKYWMELPPYPTKQQEEIKWLKPDKSPQDVNEWYTVFLPYNSGTKTTNYFYDITNTWLDEKMNRVKRMDFLWLYEPEKSKTPKQPEREERAHALDSANAMIRSLSHDNNELRRRMDNLKAQQPDKVVEALREIIDLYEKRKIHEAEYSEDYGATSYNTDEFIASMRKAKQSLTTK